MKLHGLVLAGGEGSRMHADGIADPKALVPVAGRPQAQRVLEALAGVGCASLTCAARDDTPGLLEALDSWRFGSPLRVVRCHTPTSLHTLVAGLAAVPPGAVLCSMVDTVMRQADWRQVAEGSVDGLQQGAGAVIAVTPFVSDTSALYVARGDAGQVVAFDRRPGLPPWVSGGVYALGSTVRSLAVEALRQGVSRMRGFLDWLRRRQVCIATVEISCIIDLDRATDLDLANAWLAACEPDRHRGFGARSR